MRLWLSEIRPRPLLSPFLSGLSFRLDGSIISEKPDGVLHRESLDGGKAHRASADVSENGRSVTDSSDGVRNFRKSRPIAFLPPPEGERIRLPAKWEGICNTLVSASRRFGEKFALHREDFGKCRCKSNAYSFFSFLLNRLIFHSFFDSIDPYSWHHVRNDAAWKSRFFRFTMKRSTIIGISPFEFQKPSLPFPSSAISRKIPVFSNHTMAGQEKKDGIPGQGLSDGSGRGPLAASFLDPFRQFPVCPRLPVREGTEFFPHPFLKRRSLGTERNFQGRDLSGKILSQPKFGPREDRVFLLLAKGKKAFPVGKPCAQQGVLGGQKGHLSERGIHCRGEESSLRIAKVDRNVFPGFPFHPSVPFRSFLGHGSIDGRVLRVKARSPR